MDSFENIIAKAGDLIQVTDTEATGGAIKDMYLVVDSVNPVNKNAKCGKFCIRPDQYRLVTISGDYDTGKDMVNHPAHYTSGSVEVIDLMERGYGVAATINYCELNAFKYRMRAGLKGDASEDINKALWYENKLNELKNR